MASVTMRQLLEAGIHFGHQTRRWNPKMARYIFGERNGIYIIDLQKTMQQLKRAYLLVRDTVAQGGTVLFVGTKKQAREAVMNAANRCGMYYVNSRWLGGTLTNYQTIRRRIDMLLRMEELEASNRVDGEMSKKDAIKFRKEKAKLETHLLGIKNMNRVPNILFVIDSKKEAIAIREARRLHIPCISIVDTNSDPDEVNIPIPGNDDAIRAVDLFCNVMADAVTEGQAHAEKYGADFKPVPEKLAAKWTAAPVDASEATEPASVSAGTESAFGEEEKYEELAEMEE